MTPSEFLIFVHCQGRAQYRVHFHPVRFDFLVFMRQRQLKNEKSVCHIGVAAHTHSEQPVMIHEDDDEEI